MKKIHQHAVALPEGTGGGQVLQLIIDFEFIFKSEVKSVGHKNYSCVAFTLSINLPENAKNSILETLEIKKFLKGHVPKPARNLVASALVPSLPVSSPRQCHCLHAKKGS